MLTKQEMLHQHNVTAERFYFPTIVNYGFKRRRNSNAADYIVEFSDGSEYRHSFYDGFCDGWPNRTSEQEEEFLLEDLTLRWEELQTRLKNLARIHVFIPRLKMSGERSKKNSNVFELINDLGVLHLDLNFYDCHLELDADVVASTSLSELAVRIEAQKQLILDTIPQFELIKPDDLFINFTTNLDDFYDDLPEEAIS